MNEHVNLHLQPLGRTLTVPRGTPLKDALFAHGVEFPCGGEGFCLGCRIRLIEGTLQPTALEKRVLEKGELENGWRLACSSCAVSDLTIAIAQWRDVVLTSHPSFEIRPQDGLGVAVDLGTTTLAAQMISLQTGEVLAVETALNPQAVHGGDIMRRVQFGLQDNGRSSLRNSVRVKIGQMIDLLFKRSNADASQLRRTVIVGNTVMHHIFCGCPIAPLAFYPFFSSWLDGQRFSASELQWNLPSEAPVEFLPCLGSFVGSDVLAGILASGMDRTDDLCALMDLGTNGEVVVGNRSRLLYASSAAGPAFEGASVTYGMRASTGAISAVKVRNRGLVCEVIGAVEPRGICGSGLVDAVAAGVELRWILPDGRVIRPGGEIPLAGSVSLSQHDIRELQLAKGAVAAALQILLRQWGAQSRDLKRIYLAGAFGNCIRRESALRIGLLPTEAVEICSLGNTALMGAKLSMAAEESSTRRIEDIRCRSKHVCLAADSAFQDAFVEAMSLARSG